MGEKSRNSGELGELYVANFLKLIGWNDSQSNESIGCTESEKHSTNNSKNGRTTHGIDKLYTYESPMDSNTLIHSVISVKHTAKKYPTSPNTKFKEHITDLAHTIECFEESRLITENREGYNVDNEEIVGILFWLSSGDDRDFPLILKLKLKKPILEEELLYKRIHILDNDRVEFITNSIKLITNKFNAYECSFHYIDTPNNLSDSEKQYNGKSLPIEMLSSDIQVFKLTKGQEIILAIVLKDEFNTDTLKRILGLSHRLSNNLTSNVQIFFPLFEEQTQENINSVSRIKNQFKEKEFINNVHIFGYNLGFKAKNAMKKIDVSIPSECIKDEEIDNGKILPYGENLRSLLSASLITESELKNFLQEKGIFVCNTKKEQTIPVLASLLLSPREFDILKEHQKTKEDKEKRHESRFKTKIKPKIENLKQPLKSFNLNDLDKNKFKNYEYVNPTVNFALDKDQLIVNYKIKRYQRNKSWSEQIDFFRGTVILACNGGNSEIIVTNISTAKETSEINRNIINHAKSELIKSNIISVATKEEKILMNDMSNEEILRFLLAFTDSGMLIDIEFVNIISIDIEIDETITLPDSSQIKWMENKIKKLKLDGNKIEDIEILTNDANHKYLKCWGLVAKYKYNNLSGKGNAIIDFKFNSANKNEFFIQIDKCKFDKTKYKQTEINEMILSKIDSIKHKKHKEIMDKKNA